MVVAVSGGCMWALPLIIYSSLIERLFRVNTANCLAACYLAIITGGDGDWRGQ